MDRIGVVAATFEGLSLVQLQELAREAESAGIEALFLPEFMNDALANCQVVAQVTSRLMVEKCQSLSLLPSLGIAVGQRNVLDGRASLPRLGKEAHELINLFGHPGTHRQPQVAKRRGSQGMIMGPLTSGKYICQFFSPLGANLILYDLAHAFSQLTDRLLGDISEDQGLILHILPLLFLHHLENRGGRELAELRIKRPEHSIGIHDDLIGG